MMLVLTIGVWALVLLLGALLVLNAEDEDQ